MVFHHDLAEDLAATGVKIIVGEVERQESLVLLQSLGKIIDTLKKGTVSCELIAIQVEH